MFEKITPFGGYLIHTTYFIDLLIIFYFLKYILDCFCLGGRHLRCAGLTPGSVIKGTLVVLGNKFESSTWKTNNLTIEIFSL